MNLAEYGIGTNLDHPEEIENHKLAFQNEVELLTNFADFMVELDPDIVIGWDTREE